MTETAKLLTALCTEPGISGDESLPAQKALSCLQQYCPGAEISHGSVIGSMGNPCGPHILLDAHIDQIGMIVTGITGDGFVTVGNVGGIDRRLLPAQRVTLFGKKTIPGVISCKPPHLLTGEETVLRWDEVRIDTGYAAKELKTLLSPGDSVVFSGICTRLPDETGSRFLGTALDDRCGAAAILYALSLLEGEEISCKVSVLFSTQEEVGERGAKIGCFAIDPDIALAVDVSFAGDGTKGTGIPGKGAMIGFSPSLSRAVSRDLVRAAQAENIPFQYEVMEGTTGTNADQFSVCREGVKACTVSIPLQYMHTPQEIISLSDVQNTGRLLAAYIRRCGK